MGRAPVLSGTYVTVEGGYQYIDANSVNGHGISQTGLVQGPTTDTFVDAQGGWHAGASIGFASPAAIIGGLPFTRTELYFSYGSSDDDRSDTVGPPAKTSLKSVDGSALGVVGFTATTDVERTSYEGGVRFAYDSATGANSSLTWVVTPFLRNAQEQTNSVAIGTVDTAWRSADIDDWQYGITLAAEPEVWVTPTVALVGRIGGGIYGYHADGDFNSFSTAPPVDPFSASISESESGLGFRGVLGAGIKIKLSPDMTATGFAEADYFSTTASASLPDNQFVTATTSSIATNDAWQFRTGLRLTVSLDKNNGLQ